MWNRTSSRDRIQYISNIARIAFYKSALKVSKGRLLDFIFLKTAKPRIPLIRQFKLDKKTKHMLIGHATRAKK